MNRTIFSSPAIATFLLVYNGGALPTFSIVRSEDHKGARHGRVSVGFHGHSLGVSGYEITKDPEKNAFHQTRQAHEFSGPRVGGGILFTTIFGGNDAAKSDDAEFLRCINLLNEKAIVARFYSDHDPKDLALFIESWQPAIYDKTIFANFVEAWQRDIRRLFDDNVKIGMFLC